MSRVYGYDEMINNPKVGVVSCLMSAANINPFYNLVRVLQRVTENLSVISIYTENLYYKELKQERVHNIVHNFYEFPLNKIGCYLSTQIKITCKILFLKDTNIWVFYIGEGMIIPILTAKLLGKRVLLLLGGSLENELTSHSTKLYYIILLFKKINLKLVDNIVLYSPKLVTSWNLEKYNRKIVIAHEHYLDFSKFSEKSMYRARDTVVGYIGRFSKEKGIINLLHSIPPIIKKNNNIRFLIIGDGPLRKQIESYLVENKLENYVKLVSWLPHDQLSDYLNKIKLLVVPSYSEGLPNIILESMACCTPVLATPVGAIPDIVKEGETGFIMENNSVESIYINIMRVLKDEKLPEISKKARKFVVEEFNYDKTVDGFKGILTSSSPNFTL